MFKHIFTHWGTSLAGAGLAALNVFMQGATWRQLLYSAAVAALGAIAKDPGK